MTVAIVQGRRGNFFVIVHALGDSTICRQQRLDIFQTKKNSNNAKVAKESKHFLISSVRNHQKKPNK